MLLQLQSSKVFSVVSIIDRQTSRIDSVFLLYFFTSQYAFRKSLALFYFSTQMLKT